MNSFYKIILLSIIIIMTIIIVNNVYNLQQKIIHIFVFIILCIILLLIFNKLSNTQLIERIELQKRNYESERPRVVLSFTTIPSRTQYIQNVINKIKKQSFQPDMIYVNIPYYSKRLKKKYILPKNLDLGPNVQIIRCKDYGPATKLLGTIQKEKDKNTTIITIDDDQTYHPDTLKTLVSYSIKNPDNVIAFRGLGLDLKYTSCSNVSHVKSPKKVFYVQGYGGVLYKRGFISEEMIEYFQNISPDCFVSDDLVLSTWMEIQGYDRILVCDFPKPYRDTVIDSNDALRKNNRDEVYNKCSIEMMNILKYYKMTAEAIS